MTTVAIEVYRQALRIADATQDDEIEKVAARAEAVINTYLGSSSLDVFYYEHGEDALKQLEAALVNIVVRTFDNPAEPPITAEVRAWLSVYRSPTVG